MCLVVEQKTSRVRTLPDVASPTRLGLFRKQPQKFCQKNCPKQSKFIHVAGFTKVTGDLKVGSKVTISYAMTALTVAVQ
jgi:hypothetical protein